MGSPGFARFSSIRICRSSLSIRCPLQLKACLNLVAELLVMVSQLVGDPSLKSLSLLVLLLVAEHFSAMKPVVEEMKMKMMRQLWEQRQRNARRHGLKLRFLSKTSLFASLLQGDFRAGWKNLTPSSDSSHHPYSYLPDLLGKKCGQNPKKV